MKISRVGIVVGISQSNSVICLKLYEKKIAIKATQVHIKVKIMYFYLLLFFFQSNFLGRRRLGPTKNARDPNLVRHVGPRTQNEKS